MSTQLKLRRGTTAQHSTFTGASGEITIDTDKKTVVVHDGTTAGGRALPQFDTSGNLGIGTSSPAGKLHVVGNTYAEGDIYFNTSTGKLSSGSGGWPLIFGINGVEKARIDSSGNLLVGTTSAGSTANAVWMSPSTSTIRFNNTTASGKEWSIGSSSPGVSGAGDYLSFARYSGSAWAEYARIDSSGNLLVGATSNSAYSGNGFKVNVNISGSGHTDPAVVTPQNNSTYSCWDIYSTNTSSYRFYVTTAGVVNAVSTTITAISDQRLKENIRDLDDGLATVMALKPRKFDWKEGKGAGTKNARGFIAQEFETVLPDLIDEWKDPAPEGEEPYKAVRADLIPTLVKAIQEQQAIIESQAQTIESLTQRIEALEYTKQGE